MVEGRRSGALWAAVEDLSSNPGWRSPTAVGRTFDRRPEGTRPSDFRPAKRSRSGQQREERGGGVEEDADAAAEDSQSIQSSPPEAETELQAGVTLGGKDGEFAPAPAQQPVS